MPIIPAQPQVEPKDTLSLRLDRVLHDRLKQYCQFIESPKDYVISQALRQLFRKDREFAAWSASASSEQAPAAEPESPADIALADLSPRLRAEKRA
jgi:predicted transcriptional regulator